ncbi:MAG: ABC transporter permease [Verrucomicrobiae bacterium]|nr:ABC transporter permease [Verrucomicrobiae bacterium]
MSRLPFELFLALRYFRPRGTYVSVITLIAVVGVMLAVGMLIVVISVMSGFDRELRDKILGFNAHLKIFHPQHPLEGWEKLRAQTLSCPGVRGAAPFVLGPVLVETQTGNSNRNPVVFTPYVRGVEPALEASVSRLPASIRRGEFNLTGRTLVIGSECAASLGVTVGDRLAVYSPRNLQKMRQSLGQTNEQAILPDDYTITGIFDVGHYEYNATIIATSLENAQDLYDLDDAVHGLLVMLHDPMAAERIRAELRSRLGGELAISTWMEENSVILNALAVEKQAMFVVLFVVMIVAAFGITGTQIAFVYQKTREIGILKSLGATHRQVAWLFFSQSLLVGVLGVAAGLGFGLGLLRWRNEFLRFMNQATGMDLFPSSIYAFHELPALTLPWDVIMICGSAMLLCVAAGLLPAWRAMRLHPVEALRYE